MRTLTLSPSLGDLALIRGAVYRVDFGQTRGHEQRGRRLGIVLSPTDSPLSVMTIAPTSTSAGPSIHRPVLEIAGTQTRVLVDRIRSIDIDYVHGDPIDYLSHNEMVEVESAVSRYLGVSTI